MQRTIIEMDATGQAPGRLATRIAMTLMGKHKPTYVPHKDEGDSVEVINAAKMRLSGSSKRTEKKYYKHTGYVGNLKVTTLDTLMREQPAEVLRAAVSRMLPKNRMRQERLARLKIS